MNKVYILAVALLLFASPCWAVESTTDKPSISTTQSMMFTAVVEAINYETREVTLRGQDGKSRSIVASDEARNLNQVNVGDVVVIEYMQSMSIEIIAGDGSEPDVRELEYATRSETGEMPAMTAIDALVVSAIVEEINIEANTFKLRGPSGLVKEFVARDPENLKKAAVGDIVVITYTEGIALSVEKTTIE